MQIGLNTLFLKNLVCNKCFPVFISYLLTVLNNKECQHLIRQIMWVHISVARAHSHKNVAFQKKLYENDVNVY